jgi:hypothetical protein
MPCQNRGSAMPEQETIYRVSTLDPAGIKPGFIEFLSRSQVKERFFELSNVFEFKNLLTATFTFQDQFIMVNRLDELEIKFNNNQKEN